MNLRQGVTIAGWTGLLAVCVAVVTFYTAASRTVLDAGQVDQTLQGSGAYAAIRDTAATRAVLGAINDRYPENKLIDEAMVQRGVAAALPDKLAAERFKPVVEQTYRWLDGTIERPSFTISLSDRTDAFYLSIESSVERELESLPTCPGTPYPPEQAILEDGCLPAYVTAAEATQALMGSLRAGQLQQISSLDERVVFGDALETSPYAQLPAYRDIAWTAFILALVSGALLAGYLIVRYRLLGTMALGAGLISGGILALLLLLPLTYLQFGQDPAVQRIVDVLMSDLRSATIQLATIAIGSGGITAGTAAWARKRLRKGRHA